MVKYTLLTTLLLLTLQTFSQNVTAITTKQDTMVSIPLAQLRKVMYDLQQYDNCTELVAYQDSAIQSLDRKITFQKAIIDSHEVKDVLQETTINDLKEISKLKELKINELQNDVKFYKRTTIGGLILSVLGIIFI
jgi:hypothetical protein